MARIQLRRGTAADWTSNDPVLAQGEPGIETDTGHLKIGNGTDPWTALPYNEGPPGTTSWTGLSDIPTDLLHGEVVTSLPGSPVAGKLYLIPE